MGRISVAGLGPWRSRFSYQLADTGQGPHVYLELEALAFLVNFLRINFLVGFIYLCTWLVSVCFNYLGKTM